MPLVSTKVDECKGHDGCGPRPMDTFSENVTAETFEIAREGDLLQSHGCPDHSPHGTTITRGYPTVFVNGKPIGYIGASVGCESGIMNTGRPTVIVGGKDG